MAGRLRISVTGVVQGVGFRPHVYRLAAALGLKGYVINSSGGVVAEVEGEGAEGFAELLSNDPPPLASIDSINVEHLPLAGYGSFEIRLSERTEGEFAQVSPDIATCPDCLSELLDPSDRRFLYPFINCTNCGPRYTIVKGVPYDRPLTTMSAFDMCPDCRREYEEPSDRRFHAQPVACPACGPALEFVVRPHGLPGISDTRPGNGPLEAAAAALGEGMVVAVKGLGGFHLACDATDRRAVSSLRKGKRGSNKPFALMAPDVDTVRRLCELSEQEERLLTGRARPIVLLDRKPEADDVLSPEVAPGTGTLGFMLPYTPLHHLLFRGGASGLPRFQALVMTSGNLADEPIAVDNIEAMDRLSGIADAFLLHDRDIAMRVDDSVARVVSGVPRLLRRARGYVPEAIDLGRELPEILACGAELKSTFCITKGSHAIVGQHIGDLASFETMGFYAEALGGLMDVYRSEPRIVSNDMHPDYLSTRFALDFSLERGPRPELLAVQHHHAHIAACMAENGYYGKVIGVAFDGTGYGTDGRTWGSEFLVADLEGFERFAHMDYVPLPGGDRAVREPWRTALSYAISAYGPVEGMRVFMEYKVGSFFGRDAEIVARMLDRGVNSPPSCGMGRLFDAVSSFIGLMDEVTYEAEAAIMLENAASRAKDEKGVYEYGLAGRAPAVIDPMPIVRAVVEDLNGHVPREVIAARFHNTVADMVLRVCTLARDNTGLGTAALSGGVFQNALLFTSVEAGLRDMGFRVLTHSKLPPNDGCISLGQAAVSAGRTSTKST